MTLGERLKKARNNKNISLKELSELLNERGNKVAISTISNWENNRNKPDVDTIFDLCSILNVEPNYMFNIGEKNKLQERIDVIKNISDKIEFSSVFCWLF